MSIRYWTTPGGMSGLASASGGRTSLPEGGAWNEAATAADLPPAARLEYDVEMSIPPPSVPPSLTARQLRLALHGAGLLDGVAPAIAALPEGHRAPAEISWEYATAFERRHPFILAVAQAAEMTDAQIDALFVAGARL